MSTSLRTIDPFSGLSRPTSDLRKTDLPVPDGPSSTEISPGGSVRVTSLQMFWLPNDFVSPSTSTATPIECNLPAGSLAGHRSIMISKLRKCAWSWAFPHPDDLGPHHY